MHNKDLFYWRTPILGRWHEVEADLPRDTIDTPYGEMDIVCHKDANVRGTIKEPVTIFTIEYNISVEYDFRPHKEEFVLLDWSRPSSTPAATRKIKSALKPVLAKWVQANSDKVFGADRLYWQGQVKARKTQLDNIRQQLIKRMQWLEEIDNILQSGGQIDDETKRALEDSDTGRKWNFR